MELVKLQGAPSTGRFKDSVTELLTGSTEIQSKMVHKRVLDKIFSVVLRMVEGEWRGTRDTRIKFVKCCIYTSQPEIMSSHYGSLLFFILDYIENFWSTILSY